MAKGGESYFDILTAAVNDLSANGFDSMDRVAYWQKRIREAAERSMRSAAQMEQDLKEALTAVYKRMVENGGAVKFHPGVGRFTIDKLRPQLRADLDRRIRASADLIKLNRQQAIDETLQRFSGWATSIPAGGSEIVDKRDEKAHIRKALASQPFEVRRVVVDQGHKLGASINAMIALSGGAIAARWHSHKNQAGYHGRPDHNHRDGQVFLIRGSWAQDQGFVKPGRDGYTDQIEQPAEFVFCLPGDVRVPFADSVEVGYRRWFDGELAEIITETGKTLRATPNHPVLTSNGWVGAGFLNVGDHVIEISDQARGIAKQNQDDAVATISEIFSALGEFGVAQSTSGKFEQFHGDGSEGDVDVVLATRPLTFDAVTTGPKRPRNLIFTMAACGGALRSAFDHFIKRCAGSGSRCVRSLNKLLSSVDAFSEHPHFVGVTSAPGHAASVFDVSRDCFPGDAKVSGQGENAFAKFVAILDVLGVEIDTAGFGLFVAEIDQALPMAGPNQHWPNIHDLSNFGEAPPFSTKAARVVEIKRSVFAGHVYNLQTRSGWYLADGIITHNCRCWYEYLYNLRDLPADMVTEKGRDELVRVRKLIEAM